MNTINEKVKDILERYINGYGIEPNHSSQLDYLKNRAMEAIRQYRDYRVEVEEKEKEKQEIRDFIEKLNK